MKHGSKFLAPVLSILAVLLALFPQLTPHAQQQNQRQQDPATIPQPLPPSPAASSSPTPASADAVEPGDEVLTVETNLVDLPFSVTDRNRRFVTTLIQEDIRVYEDGAPQAVATFQREADQPLALAILIDTSGSQDVTLPDEKDAANSFIDAVVRPERDRVAVISFHTDATVEQDLIGEASALHSAIERIELPRRLSDRDEAAYVAAAAAGGEDPQEVRYKLPGWSAIWDAVWATTNEIMPQASERARRAIILLSDGEENSNSSLKKEDVIEAALKANTIIYCIGIGSGTLDEGALKKISERTGGRAYFPEDETELGVAFAQIQQELRSQYLVTYSPANKARDNSYRQLRIEIVNPVLKKQKLKLSYRQGYFARPPTPPAPNNRTTNRTLAKPPRRPKRK